MSPLTSRLRSYLIRGERIPESWAGTYIVNLFGISFAATCFPDAPIIWVHEVYVMPDNADIPLTYVEWAVGANQLSDPIRGTFISRTYQIGKN